MRRLQREFPESPFIPQSWLFLAMACLDENNLDKAEEALNLILEKYPQLNEKEEVTFLLARVAIERQGKAQAIELLEKTLRTVKTAEKKMEILIRMAVLYMDLKQWDKAVSVIEGAPRKRGMHELSYKADLITLVCLGEMKQYDKALQTASKMLKSRYYIIHYPDIQLRKGRVLVKSGKIDAARVVFEQITKSAGSSQPLQGEAWYELGLIYQHHKGDFTKAKECYDKAASLASEESIKKDAALRAEAISSIISARSSLNDELGENDTTADSTALKPAADTSFSPSILRYGIGENFWLRLEEPDSALNHFNIITSDTSAGDTIKRQALFAKAWIMLHMKQDSVSADSLFRYILGNYPATMYAKKAQAELGDSVTVMTREDSAMQAFTAAENLYFNDNDAVAASNAYLQVAKTYPELATGPKSIYAAAWMCDNVLNKNKTARLLYKMLCDSFPESELCAKEAKPRLQAVEDTLDAIKGVPREKKKEDEEGKDSSKIQQTSKDSIASLNSKSQPDSMWRYRRGYPGMRADWRRGMQTPPGPGGATSGPGGMPLKDTTMSKTK
jgi:tetratricopeptide (TPR) repeat protein